MQPRTTQDLRSPSQQSGLACERAAIDQEMARWLLRSPQPVMIIDWSDLKPDKG
ncbi:hypothetical protein XFF6991_530174 [Xanthomonas phaseoli pv. phaseoli]|uniref:Uncharacterized protein n=1 Tax=Xanthomonas campestris pv. phaseoli TaxID=317013 RepID=A0A7Z7J5Y4_XANCH|nr:hypothetical protein XFF6991_530174 [Xanthomonas phaseoli pv. phaseoli]